ncbi:phage protease [uncultured Desulfovibrio sp.]|uniref:phage protease n=1 Tax=uncultured Desulfovibrio sp. TaxID=167968 RepID=UPI00260AF127|nr:phage protease [uncultured Desulfovibrio sp.]
MTHLPTPSLPQAALAAPLAADADGGGHGGEIQLFPAGKFAALDGRPATLEGLSLSHWRLDAGDAAALVADWRSRATPLVVDYEHQTQLVAHNGQPAPAAGWLTGLRWEEGRGLFASVDWTERARAHIRAREYRYISPVFCFDPQSGAVLRLVCAALTNHPALDGMAPALASRLPVPPSLGSQPKEENMKQVLAALGLPETAGEAEALAALTALQEERDSAKARADAAPDPQRYVAMSTFTALQREAAQLRAEADGLRAEARAAALKEDIEAALADGRLTAATKDWAEGLAQTAPEALQAYLAAQPPVQALTRTQTGGRPPADDQPGPAALSAEEEHICASLGLTREEFIQARQREEK